MGRVRRHGARRAVAGHAGRRAGAAGDGPGRVGLGPRGPPRSCRRDRLNEGDSTVRAYVTGGTGFVGSNIVKVFADRHGATVHCPVHRFVPADTGGFTAERLDLLDDGAVQASVDEFDPDVIVHSMILNDFAAMYADRDLAWRSFAGTTESLARAADRVEAKLILVSTDWVFDGTQAGADEDTPPNPVNLYGVLKMASEQTAMLSAARAAVARVSAVSGMHWMRDSTPRVQDGGFGYFVTSIVEALEAGEPFAVWEADNINMVASPSLASECAEVMWRIAADASATGIFHCCGAESVGRMELARIACDVFDLDPSLLGSTPPDTSAVGAVGEFPIPYDTSLTVRRTREVLGYEPPGIRDLLARFRTERASGSLAA
ncbi:MAG: sugar nucleotide-binding protein [Acidimicrobiaceae bacterium]|nr:sugar nucleotide-binding protein [Acidimicrobiaceae bacterium]